MYLFNICIYKLCMRDESEDFKTASQKQLVIVVLMEYIGLFFKLPIVMNQGGGGDPIRVLRGGSRKDNSGLIS